MNAVLKQVFLIGKQAKENGYDRLSPHTSMEYNHYWYAGYDGLQLSEIVKDKSMNAELSYSRIGLNNT